MSVFWDRWERFGTRLKAEDPRKSGSLAWLLAVLRKPQKPEPQPQPVSTGDEIDALLDGVMEAFVDSGRIPAGWKQDGMRTNALLEHAGEVIRRRRG